MFPRLIGVIHLLPLPGAPGYEGDLASIEQRALRDAGAYTSAGFDGILLENFGDVPFFKDSVERVTVAAMSRIACRLREKFPVSLGVQVLRNDALSALAVAAVSGAEYIRVNVLAGVMATDQGLIEGNAAEIQRARAGLCPEVSIFADVLVKHAQPLSPVSMNRAVKDLVQRAMADAVIVTGDATGSPVDWEDLREAKVASTVPVYIGSGVTDATVRQALEIADGVIVGSAVKRGGDPRNAVDLERARAFVKKMGLQP